jgi:hypothetical protein
VTAGPIEPLEPPVWYAPLRSPSWLVPVVREGAPTIVFCAEAWDDQAVGAAGRDLRLGLPVYLAEAVRFGTNARPFAGRLPLSGSEVWPDAPVTVRSAVGAEDRASIRLRVVDATRDVIAEVAREAHDEATLGAVLEGLPRAVVEAVGSAGIRPAWSSLYSLPTGSSLAAYVRGQRACLRLSDGALPATADTDSIATRRADVRAVLEALGSLATSSPGPFPAMLFFGALLAAHEAGSPVVGDFRMQASVRWTAATDPVDPIYAIAALVMRVFGDLDASDRRIEVLRARDDRSMRRWLADVQTVT